MQSIGHILLLAFAIMASFINTTQAGNLIVKNMCNFPVYCYASRAKVQDTIPHAPPYDKILSGSQYTSGYPALDDNVGVCLHCGIDDAVSTSSQYQLELAVKDGVSFADLSAINGDPFLQYQRAINYPGSADCPAAACDAGATGCDYPLSLNCNTQGDVYMYLCGSY